MFNFKTQTNMKRKYSEEERSEKMMLHKHFSRTGNPALYVGTYGKYNSGSLYGMWVDLATFSNYQEFIEFCRLLHWDERDPELMFQDFEGFPEEWYSECGIGEKTFDLIVEYALLSDDDKEMVDAYATCTGERDIDAARDNHLGQWDSEEDFAYHIFDEMYAYQMPESLQHYFDIKRLASDLFDFDYYFENGHVFNR